MDNQNPNELPLSNPPRREWPRKRTFPVRFVSFRGEPLKMYYDHEYQEMVARLKAEEEARQAARQAELAASRPQQADLPIQEIETPPVPEEPESSGQLAESDAPLDSAAESVTGGPSPETPPLPELVAKPKSATNLARRIDNANPAVPDYARHARLCTVCSHPDRDAIEGDYIRWRSILNLSTDYDIARSTIYRHVHATGLDRRRSTSVSRVLERFLEESENFPVEEFDVVTRAVRAYAHMDDNGRWWEPPRTNYNYVFHGTVPPPMAPASAPILTISESKVHTSAQRKRRKPKRNEPKSQRRTRSR